MSLSANVEALLAVYSKCLGLLHVFGDPKKQSTGAGAGAAAGAAASASPDWDRHSRLSRSLQSDRAKVMTAFSSRLSESGTRLARGDTRSRSALRRIVHRLTDVLDRIFRRGTRSSSHAAGANDGQPLLDYDALRALSSASRVGAIHAIDDLSVRLKKRRPSSPSAARVKTVKTAKTPPSSVQHSGRSAAKEPTARQGAGKGSGSPGPSAASRRSSRSARASPSRKQPKEPSGKTGKTSSIASGAARSDSFASGSTTSTAKAGPLHKEPRLSPRLKRSARPVSMVSSSSASTRLGEIPARKLQRRRAAAPPPHGSAQDAFAYYAIRPAYPMRPLWMPEADPKEKKKGREKRSDDKKKRLWGFGRA